LQEGGKDSARSFPIHLLPLEEPTQDDSGKIKELNKCLSDKIIKNKLRRSSVRELKSPRLMVPKKNTYIDDSKTLFFKFENKTGYKAEVRYRENESKKYFFEKND
jgi:hypothetical protein